MVLCFSIAGNIDRMNAYGSGPVTRARASSTSSIVDSASLEKLAPVRISGPAKPAVVAISSAMVAPMLNPSTVEQCLTVARWAASRP
jgi:hypothetical protein